MKRAETGIDNNPGEQSPPTTDLEEERYRLAVEATELGSWDYFPLTGNIVLSDKCRALLGVHDSDNISYSEFLEYVHREDRKQVDLAIRKALVSTDKKSVNCEFRTIVQKNHQPQWVRLTGKLLCNDQGQVNRILGLLLNINEKKAVDRAGTLQKLMTDLERSNQNLEEFAFMASHDLQEPLRKIRIFTQLMQEKLSTKLSESDRVYLDKINSSAIRMGSLIRSLLDYSRLSGKGAQYVTTNLNEIVKTVVSDLDIAISRNNATIHIGSLPVIDAIPIQIVQLFTNLISNALKFACDHSPPVIRIAARPLAPHEALQYPALNPALNYTGIAVTDNGIGFDPAFAEQIFGIFQRLHGQHQYEGTGIGLSICRKIATNHNGLIFAESQKDQGTTFHIILPFKQVV